MARPRKESQKKDETIRARVTKTFKEKLEKHLEEDGLDVSEFLVAKSFEYIQEKEKQSVTQPKLE